MSLFCSLLDLREVKQATLLMKFAATVISVKMLLAQNCLTSMSMIMISHIWEFTMCLHLLPQEEGTLCPSHVPLCHPQLGPWTSYLGGCNTLCEIEYHIHKIQRNSYFCGSLFPWRNPPQHPRLRDHPTHLPGLKHHKPIPKQITVEGRGSLSFT